MRTSSLVECFVLLLCLTCSAPADDPVFSGPQAGEKITSFKVTGVYGEDAGKVIDFVKRADGKPVVLVFNHKLTRPGAALMRSVTSYALSRKKDGLTVFVVWLAEDKSKAEEYLTRAKLSIAIKAPIGISVDGEEGPGAYGLNRNVEQTVIIANKNKVTANFALVQPSVTDAPKIAKQIVKVIGGKAPTQEEMNKLAYPNQKMRGKKMTRGAQQKPVDPQLGDLLRRVIQKDNDADQVAKAAAAVEKFVGDSKEHSAQVARIAGVIVNRKYGTDTAQKQAAEWIEKYGKKEEVKKEPVKKVKE